MDILLICNDFLLVDVLSLAFESVLEDVNFIHKSDAKEVAATLKSNSPIDYIVYCNTKKNIALDNILSALEAKKQKPQLLFLSDKAVKINYPHVTTFSLPPDITQLIAAVSPKSGNATQGWRRIKMETLFASGNLFQFDVYVKLADKKFVKLLTKNDTFERSDYQHYSRKNIKYLYLKEADFKQFIERFSKDMYSLSHAKETKIEHGVSFELIQSAHEILHDSIPNYGFTPELQTLAKNSIDTAIHTIRQNPKLREFLENQQLDNESYISWHSTLLTFIATRLAMLMDWDSDQTYYKLSLAAFLHDITLQNPELAKIQTLEELNKQKLSTAERAQYMDHPYKAAALVREMSEFPTDVDFVVAQHHEQPDGSGFPKQLKAIQISPLSSLFIIAHHISFQIMKMEKNFNFEQFIAENYETYNRAHFKKIFMAMKKALTNQIF